MTTAPKSNIQWVKVENLRLDPRNPRLPEEMDGTISSDVIQFYWNNYVLDELVNSFRENGYFEQEPMIVVPEGAGNGKSSTHYIVLEGNRRLSALIQLLQLPGHQPKIRVDPPTAEQRSALSRIPCFVTDSRESVASHLGFKHI